MRKYSEDHAVEQPAIDLFENLGWETINAYEEVLATEEDDGTLGRGTRDLVVLQNRLREKLVEFNPEVPEEQIYDLMRDGVDLEYRDEDGPLIRKPSR